MVPRNGGGGVQWTEGPQLPSLSPLTGVYRPGSASSLTARFLHPDDARTLGREHLHQMLPTSFRILDFDRAATRRLTPPSPKYLQMRKGKQRKPPSRSRSLPSTPGKLTNESTVSEAWSSDIQDDLKLMGRKERLLDSPRRESRQSTLHHHIGTVPTDCGHKMDPDGRENVIPVGDSTMENADARQAETGPCERGTPMREPSPTGSHRFTRLRDHPMANFRPTRAHMFVVFTKIDTDMNGKITRSEFEDAAFSIGYGVNQAAKLFNRLDTNRRGYIDYRDWGQTKLMAVILRFTHLFMMQHLGLPGVSATREEAKAYFQQERAQEVRNLVAAINQAKRKMLAWGARSSTGGSNALFEAFRFIDADNNGVLSHTEIADALHALGVHLSGRTLDKLVERFDIDGNGHVDYFEFVRSLFPRQAY